MNELLALWRRFEEWTAREDRTTGFVCFFQDLNRWETDGPLVIRKTAALLLFASALVFEADKMRLEDFLARLGGRLPVRREFSGECGRRAYSVTFSVGGEALLFEKEGRVVRLGEEEIRQVWNRFVDWWCMPSRDGSDERVGLDFGDALGGDARFYAFELACLMNELQQCQVFAGVR